MTRRYTPAHERHLAALSALPVAVDRQGLRLGDTYVMFFAEADLMALHARCLLEGSPQADVLEVGLGLGIFADQLHHLPVRSYTAVEPHSVVAAVARDRVLSRLQCDVTVFTRPWQLTTFPDAAYDAIMYDTWPPDGLADADFACFVEHVAVPALRPGGRFSFFHSGSELAAARRDVLDQFFASWSMAAFTLPAEAVPPAWTKPTREFVVPVAIKGGH